MVLKKIILISVATLGTAGAVAGVGTGISYAVQNNNSSENTTDEISKDTINTKPEDKGNKSVSNVQGDEAKDDQIGTTSQEESIAKLSVEQVIKHLKENDVLVIRPYKEQGSESKLDLQDKVTLADIQAYKVKKEQIDLVDKDKYSKWFDFEFDIKNTNTLDTLNGGELTIEAKVTKKPGGKSKSGETKTEDIKISGFKKAEDSSFFNDLFKEKDTTKYQLTLEPAESNGYGNYSIEDLNRVEKRKIAKDITTSGKDGQEKSVSGLTEALWNSKFDAVKLGDLTIKGEVKLEKIDTDNDNVEFYLVSANANNPLRVVKELEEKKTEEVLVSGIKIQNLLATDVSVVPLQSSNKKHKDFIKQVKEDASNHKEYSVDLIDANLNRELAVNLATDSTSNPANNLFIKPFVLENSEIKSEKNIDVEILVSFGNKTNSKTYATSINDDRDILNKAGFNFEIYTKTLEGKDVVVEASKLKEGEHKLNNYFKDENYKGFKLAKGEVNDNNLEAKRKENGNFYVTKVETSNLEKITIDVQKSKGSDDIGSITAELPTNLLAFASYSYKNKDKTKAATTPVLSIFHLKAKANN